jgi:NADP-dependent 3-hydroxy acid dehydrogenase YdfG
MADMDGRVVVITGASSGVGRATARAFAHAGADLALLARGRHGLEITAKEVESSGRRAAVFPTDVADPDQVEASASEIETHSVRSTSG